MKKKQILLISHSTLLFLVIISCGVLLDATKLPGTWVLDDVEFYAHDPILDATKIYVGLDDQSPDPYHPIEAEFFCEKAEDFAESGKPKYKMVIDHTNNNFEIIRTTGTTSVKLLNTEGTNANITSISVDSYNNTIEYTVRKNDTAKGFWRNPLKITNYWPMANYNTLELLIKAEDTTCDYFEVDLANDVTIKAYAMKGIFLRK